MGPKSVIRMNSSGMLYYAYDESEDVVDEFLNELMFGADVPSSSAPSTIASAPSTIASAPQTPGYTELEKSENGLDAIHKQPWEILSAIADEQTPVSRHRRLASMWYILGLVGWGSHALASHWSEKLIGSAVPAAAVESITRARQGVADVVRFRLIAEWESLLQ